MFAPLLGAEAVKDAVVEVDELLQHVLARPRIARVVLVGQPPLGEVDRDADGAGVKAPADVLFDLVDHVVEERVAGVAVDLAVQRVQQHHHRRRDHRLLDVMRRDRLVLADELRRVGLVAKRATRDARQLAVVAVVEDGEELPVTREVVGQAGARQRVGDRVGGKARLPLLAIGHDRLARVLQAMDRVLGCLVLLSLQVGESDLALVVGLVGVLELLRPGQRPDELGPNRHALSSGCFETDRSPAQPYRVRRRRRPAAARRSSASSPTQARPCGRPAASRCRHTNVASPARAGPRSGPRPRTRPSRSASALRPAAATRAGR